MKNRNRGIIVAMLAGFALLCGTSTASAGLINSINLPGLSFGLDSYGQPDGRDTFSVNLSTLDRIDTAYVSFNQDPGNPSQGWAMYNINGTVGALVTPQSWQSSAMGLDYRGLVVDTNVGVGTYQNVVSWEYPADGGDGTPIFGDWMSSSNARVTVSGASLVTSYGGYNEYPISDDGGKGTAFSAWAQFQLQFDSPASAAIFGAMKPNQITAVPEPVTLSLLAIGGLALIRRRRQRS